jgi:hypothetical protein
VSNTSLAWRRVTVGLVSAAVVVALSSAGLLNAASASADTGEHVVLAYYYAWWEPDRISGALYTPAQQYAPGIQQIVNDPNVLKQHIAEAQSAGIDGFVLNRASDLAVLLPLARAANFSISLQAAGDESQVREFYKYIDDPAILRYQGHPVLFFWQSGTAGNDYWNNVRQNIDPDHNVLWIADGDNFNILEGVAWDGISPYAIAWSANPAQQLPNWSAKARNAAPGKLYIPPVSPGCDDSLVRTATCVQDRADGAYYGATWRGALAAHPTWAIIVSTFNEWMESTQIEPSVQYGDQYLELTRQYADMFKGTDQQE